MAPSRQNSCKSTFVLYILQVNKKTFTKNDVRSKNGSVH